MQRVARFILCACLVLCTAAAAAAQTLTSDKTDYAPGETATLTGSGFIANETVTLQVLHADGSPATGAEHLPWTVTASASGGFTATWHVCEDDCIGALLEATAVGQSGLKAAVRFTDAQQQGNGVVSVTAVGGSCVVGSQQSASIYAFAVSPGGTYTMTITGVTECTGSAITVFVQNSGAGGNFCFTATGGGGTYSGQFTMPNPACNTMPVSYKCGAGQPCNNANSFDAKGPGGEPGVHLVASTFGTGCSNPVTITSCAPTCTLTCPPDKLLHCGDPTDPSNTGTATTTGGCTATFSDRIVGGCTGLDIDRTWTAGTLSCVQHITFEDKLAPLLAGVPSGEDLGCNPKTLPTCDPAVTATDNCDQHPTVTCTPGLVTGTGCNKSQTFTYTATDKCGNKASMDVTYTWKEDTTKPVLANVPAGGELGCNPTLPACDSRVTATDNCDREVQVECTPGTITSTGCFRRQVFTYSAKDSCNNEISQDVVYTWKEDQIGPVLAHLPAGGDLGCNPKTLPGCDPAVTAADECSGAVPVVCTPGQITSTGCNRRQVFTYSAEDSCRNKTSEDVVYTWKEDTTKPVLANVPAGGELGCNPTLPACDSRVTATDNCDREVQVECTPGTITSTGCFRRQVFTYSAKDSCNNEISQDVVYTWKEDQIGPVLAHLPAGRDLGCNPDTLPSCDPAVTAADECDGPVPVLCTPGSITSDGCFRRQEFTYSAADSCGNKTTEKVVYTWKEDRTPPVLAHLPAGGDLGCNPTRPICSEDVTATDNCPGDVRVLCVSHDIVANGCRLSQTFTYTATDECGNKASQDVTYTWKEDQTGPVLAHLPVGRDLGCNPAPPICATDVTATDECSGNAAVTCTPGAITSDGCMRRQVFTYSATDSCGNKTSEDVTYTWKVDVTKPVLPTLPAGGDLGCNPPPPTCVTGLMAQDDCDGPVPVTCTPGLVTGTGCNKSQTFTYSATDACGNTASQGVTYTWKDDHVPPTISCTDITVTVNPGDACPTLVNFANFTATDNCGGPVTVSPLSGTFPPGTTSVTITAVDSCGNKATCMFNVIVKTALCVNKFNDYNANGKQDATEPGVPGVTFTLTPGGVTAVTDAGGKACFTGLVAGSYTVTESVPSGWVATSPTSQTVTLACPTTVSFGDGRLGGCGGLTPGFWSNKNGQALETGGDFMTLSMLCLRNADGSDRDFPGTLAVNKTALNAWLLNGNATNMAYMLSVQLTAMRLNVAHGFVTGTALVYAPGCGNTGLGNNFISITDLMTAANTELCAHPVTLSGSPYRAAQECLQLALDGANNNRNFIVTPSCPTGQAPTGRNGTSSM